jgi:hypothetical protein
MRTASLGGSWPSRRKRRVFEYDAVSTSTENVDSGRSLLRKNGLSSTRA